MKIEACIFDFDGTLFDTMPIWDTAGADYLRAKGCVPEAGLSQKLAPLSLLQGAQYLKNSYSLPWSVEEILRGIRDTVADFYLHTAAPKPYVREFLEAYRNIPMCIATATDRTLIEAALTRCGLRQYFSRIFTCPEVGQGKDQPHIYEAALSHLGTQKESTPVFEDAYYAARTAKNAGFPVIAIYDPSEAKIHQLQALADLYCMDFRSLL